MNYAEAGHQPFTSNQILNCAYTIVFITSLYFDECKEWTSKPLVDKSWANFKSFVLKAQNDLQMQQQTSCQVGFH